jgi:hypothetical protein
MGSVSSLIALLLSLAERLYSSPDGHLCARPAFVGTCLRIPADQLPLYIGLQIGTGTLHFTFGLFLGITGEQE